MERLVKIGRIAASLGISQKYLELYGNYKAKVSLDILSGKASRPRGKYIVVTGMTPTPLGEGKTVTTIGLSMALNRFGRKSVACIRQASLGPFFGTKGGATGGGRCRILPEVETNLHLTGDFHAVGAAHNLCAAFLDNHLYRGNSLGIDLDNIFWHRVIDINDRALRSVKIGVGGGEYGVERMTRFDITAASELMALLALSESIPDMRKKVSRIVVALTKDGKIVTAKDMKVAGAIAAILKDAMKPNLVQTAEHTPCFIHTGPFANITHGNSSILADRMALGLADFVVTESGFGADCGLEKFVDIKCRASGLIPDAAVLVSSLRAIKMHSGRFKVSTGRPLDKAFTKEDLAAIEEGASNLEKQIENVKAFGLPCIVAINRFDTDTKREIDLVKKIVSRSTVSNCVVSELYSRGSRGGEELARAVMDTSRKKADLKFLYPLNIPIKEKIKAIATKMYGTGSVEYTALAEAQIGLFEKIGLGRLPLCMAKTHLSLSHDPNLKGRPAGFTLPVREIRPVAGAGFLSPICGSIMTMPSLPSRPVGERIDIDSKGALKYVH